MARTSSSLHRSGHHAVAGHATSSQHHAAARRTLTDPHTPNDPHGHTDFADAQPEVEPA